MLRYFELLECRNLLSATDPSGREWQSLMLINRMRANPQAELALIENTSDPDVQEALTYFHVSLSDLASQFSTLTPVAPLAWNSSLASASLTHNSWMLADDTQSHQLPNEPDFVSRDTSAGYTNYSSLRESIYAYASSVVDAQDAFAVDWGNTSDGIQSPAGHRENIMAADVNEVGISFIDGTAGKSTGPLLVTEDFGARRTYGNPQLLGSVYQDGNGDGYYTDGEGIAAATVTLTGPAGIFTTQTMSAGGYETHAPAGTYQVTFSGGELPHAISYDSILIGRSNVELDLNVNSYFASRSGSILMIAGTDGADVIHVSQAGSQLTIDRNGVSESFNAANFTQLNIAGGIGADAITIDPTVTLPAFISGGRGPDTLIGGSGPDTLNGGKGPDSLVSGSANSILHGQVGNDTLRSSFGSSQLLGCPGTNTMDPAVVRAETAQFLSTTSPFADWTANGLVDPAGLLA